MVESEDWRNALHLARMGVLYGSIIEVSLSSMALFVITTYRNKIEVELGMGDHGWVAIYSTLCTTSVMFLSGILGLATTWSREKVRKNVPLVKRQAFAKAAIEGGLFLYMIPYNIVVAIWIITFPGVSPLAKAVKILLSTPSMFFQFCWFMACRHFWQVLRSGHGEDLVMPNEAVHTFADLSEPLLPEDSSGTDVSGKPVFKSASQFGPMGMPGLGMPVTEGSTTDAGLPEGFPGISAADANGDAGEDVKAREVCGPVI